MSPLTEELLTAELHVDREADGKKLRQTLIGVNAKLEEAKSLLVRSCRISVYLFHQTKCIHIEIQKKTHLHVVNNSISI